MKTLCVAGVSLENAMKARGAACAVRQCGAMISPLDNLYIRALPPLCIHWQRDNLSFYQRYFLESLQDTILPQLLAGSYPCLEPVWELAIHELYGPLHVFEVDSGLSDSVGLQVGGGSASGSTKPPSASSSTPVLSRSFGHCELEQPRLVLLRSSGPTQYSSLRKKTSEVDPAEVPLPSPGLQRPGARPIDVSLSYCVPLYFGYGGGCACNCLW